MADTKKTQPQQAQADPQTPSSSGIPDYRSDRDELKEASQQFFRTLFQSGVHLAMAPVYFLPEEPREHFITAGREITRGLATLAHELADDFEKAVDQAKGEVQKVRGQMDKARGEAEEAIKEEEKAIEEEEND
jgi:hypothetical protein